MLSRILTIAMLIATITGCVGIAVISPSTKIRYPSSEKSYFFISKSGEGRYSFGYRNYKPQTLNKDLFLNLWGVATNIVELENNEVWIYKRDVFKWFGVMPMVLIPIPLAVPVGKSTVEVYFSQDKVIKVTYNNTSLYGFYIGPNDHGPEIITFNIIRE